MAALDDMDHTLTEVPLSTLQDRASYVGYNYSWLGENIAEGFPDATTVMTGWMNSPGHKANILETNFTDIGVVVAQRQRHTLFLRRFRLAAGINRQQFYCTRSFET